jgi:hypothetical protein
MSIPGWVMLVSIVGAVTVLLLYHTLTGRRTTR